MKESFFQFSDPQIADITFKINENFNKEVFSGLSIGGETEKIMIEEGSEALVKLKIVIGEESEEYPFYLSMTMIGLFRRQDNGSNISFEDLLDTNAPALLLSYARPIVSLITSQSGCPTLNLPFMNFSKDK